MIETNTAHELSPHISGRIDHEKKRLKEFALEINSVINPPEKLTGAQIEVRSLYVVSDQTNHYGGKFEENELQRIAGLLIDSPVLVGHRKDTLPIARIFRSEVVTRGNQRWVKAHCYWLRSALGAETLRTNIDGGLYKECSLGFTFTHAECAICGEDFRACAHSSVAPPTTEESSSGKSTSTDSLYYYRDIRRTLEVSLVYRGATPHTKIGGALGFSETTSEMTATELSAQVETESYDQKSLTVELFRADSADSTPDSSKLVRSTRLYDGIPLFVGREGGELFTLTDDGSPAPAALSQAALSVSEFPAEDFLMYARLNGMRGKERRSATELIRKLRDDAGPVRSFSLRALALLSWNYDTVTPETKAEFNLTLKSICRNSRRIFCSTEITNGAPQKEISSELIFVTGDSEITIVRCSDSRSHSSRSEAVAGTEEFCGIESPLSTNLPPNNIRHNQLYRLSDAESEQVYIIPDAKLNAGLCCAFKDFSTGDTVEDKITKLSPGQTISFNSVRGEDTQARVIVLTYGPRSIPALLEVKEDEL